MNTATKYSVSDAATLYKKSRATLYKDIKNGVLSRDHDGFIDFSELLRVYGEPFGVKQVKRIDTSPIQNQNTSEYTDKTVVETDTRSELEPKDDGLTTPVETENKRIPVPEHVEPEQPKRGFLSRFFLPNG